MKLSPRDSDLQVNEQFVEPPVNIRETEDSIFVEAEMSGIDKEHLEVLVEGDELVILGHRPRMKNDGEPIFQEIPKCDYRRAFTIGDHINRSDIHASIDGGVLVLKLSKADEAKVHKIQVQ
jgi:HSP20 family protein